MLRLLGVMWLLLGSGLLAESLVAFLADGDSALSGGLGLTLVVAGLCLGAAPGDEHAPARSPAIAGKAGGAYDTPGLPGEYCPSPGGHNSAGGPNVARGEAAIRGDRARAEPMAAENHGHGIP